MVLWPRPRCDVCSCHDAAKVQEAKMEFDTGAKKGGEMEGEVGSGAQIAWNTGLAEIALPIEFKLK